MTIVVRPRRDADVEDVVRIASAVQAVDGHRAGGRHVALQGESLPVVMTTAASLGRDACDLAVVARLIVDPATRRLGIGRALLRAASDDARRNGLHPILDVATHHDGAIALYRSCGWQNVGEVTMVFGDGGMLQSYVFVAPGP